jgi:hypothetical protein
MTAAQQMWAVPDGLPAGGFIVPQSRLQSGVASAEPALWITDDPVPDLGSLYARLLAAHGDTGLWPLLLTERSSPIGITSPALSAGLASRMRGSSPLFADGRPWHAGEIMPVPAYRIAELDADELLARDWDREADANPDRFDFGTGAFPGVEHPSWPGLAEPVTPGPDPDDVLARVVTAPGGVRQLTPNDRVYLGLVPSADSAAALTAAGWKSNAGSAAEIAAVIRSWQQRFGVRLCAIGFDTLALSVAWPPLTAECARRVAAEHAAFCPDIDDDLAEYARTLQGAAVWQFWWD